MHDAAEIRTLAERQMGEFLKAMPKATGGQPYQAKATGAAKEPVADENRGKTETLSDLGITKKQSSTAQKLASIPEPEFRERVAVGRASTCPLRRAGKGRRGLPRAVQ